MFLVRITRENGTHESKLYFDYLAIEFQNFAAEVCDLSYSELYHIGTALEKAAKRYGLVKEFRENGII